MINKVKLALSIVYRFFFPIDMVTMYKKMGVQIGERCKIQNGVVIDYSHYWHIQIGDDVTIAPHVHILAHDTSTKLYLGYTRIGNVLIEDKVFIGARSIILPGIIIGEGSIIGAGSLVNRSIPPRVVAAGNPVKIISSLEEYLVKMQKEFDETPHFSEQYTLRKNISTQLQNEMKKKIGQGFGYVE